MKLTLLFFLLTLTNAFATEPLYSPEEIAIGLKIVPPSQLVISGEDICGNPRLHEEYRQQFEEAILKYRREHVQPLTQILYPSRMDNLPLIIKLPRDTMGITEKKRKRQYQRPSESLGPSCVSSKPWRSYNPSPPRKSKKKKGSNYYFRAKTYGMSNEHVEFLGAILLSAAERGETIGIVSTLTEFKNRFSPMSITTFAPWLRKSMYAFNLKGVIRSQGGKKITPKIEATIYTYLSKKPSLTSRSIYKRLKKSFPGQDFATEKTVRRYISAIKFGFQWQEGWRFSPEGCGRLKAPRS